MIGGIETWWFWAPAWRATAAYLLPAPTWARMGPGWQETPGAHTIQPGSGLWASHRQSEAEWQIAPGFGNLVSTTAGGPTSVNAKPEIAALLMRVGEESIETRVRRTFTAIAGEGYMAAHPDELELIVKSSIAKPMSLASYQRQLGACIDHSFKGVAERLGQITAPTVIIHGECDPLIPYENGKCLAAHITGARLSSYPGVGHLLPIEAPERFNREVIEFLE